MLFPKLEVYLQEALSTFNLNTCPRKAELERLAQWLVRKQLSDELVRFTIICTHNSRRSHIGQFWLAAAGALHGMKLEVFSGGMEATACHPNTLAALERAGAVVKPLSIAPNIHWNVSYGPEGGVEAWSKVYSDSANPQVGYAAVMVCTDADERCPVALGAEARFSLPYQDPKHADGSPQEAAAYDLACRTIGAEMAWVVWWANEMRK